MSLGRCIPELIEQGKLPEGRAAEIRAVYDGLVDQYGQHMGKAAAEAKATGQTIKLLEADQLNARRRALLQAKVQDDWLTNIEAKAGDGPIDWRHAEETLARIDKKIDALRGLFFRTMDGMLEKHRRNIVGVVRQKSDLIDALRHMRGEKVDSLNARELGDAMNAVLEMVRQRANAAGASIGKIKNYGLPQAHDARRIREAGYEAWRASGPVQRVQVLDIETGEFAQGAKREELLAAMFETMRTDGANKIEPGAMGRGSLATRRDHARYMHFESTDDWLEYQAEFGRGDSVYDIFSGHVSAMARDIALMEELGPNPAATMRFQADAIEKSVKMKGTTKQIEGSVLTLTPGVDGQRKKIMRIYNELSGSNKVPDNQPLALTFSAIRAQQVAAKLGSALLSSATDFATLLYRAKINGLPIMQTVGQYAKLWLPGSSEDRRLAVRLGLVTDDWIGLSSSTARYTGEELTGEISRRVADFVIRGQGLARHTRNAQWAHGMQYLSMLTQQKHVGYEQLDEAIMRQFRRHGIDASTWDAYRATEPVIERGSDWIMPGDAGKAGERILQLVLAETDLAVITPDIRTRAMINDWAPVGTPGGELLRSALLFKSFPLAIINLHGRRMMESPHMANRLAYGLGLVTTLTAAGALSVQLKQVGNGKDPQPMDDRKFWGRSVIQSGGFSLFGDLLYNSENSYGGGFGKTLLGPVLGQTVPNIVDATAGNAIKAVDGDDATKTSFAKDISMTAVREVPGSNMWYYKFAWERIIVDTIREWSDPDYQDAYQRMQRNAEDQGTEYWWAPGDGEPERAPMSASAAQEGSLLQ